MAPLGMARASGKPAIATIRKMLARRGASHRRAKHMAPPCCTLTEMIEYDRATRQIGMVAALRFRYRRDDLSERHISRVPVEVDEQQPGMGTIALVQREEVVAVRGEDGSPFGLSQCENFSVVCCISKLLDGCDHVVTGRVQPRCQFARVQALVNDQAQGLVQPGDALPPPRLRAKCRYAPHSRGLRRWLPPADRTLVPRRRFPAGLPLSGRRVAQP